MEITIRRDNAERWLSPVRYTVLVDGDYFKAKDLCAKEFPFACTLWGAKRIAKQIAERPVDIRKEIVYRQIVD